MELNERQREAVEHEGPLLVVAGAGSGKTRTLVAKVEHLIKKGHPPERILCLTFTNKAAREIKKRIEETLRVELPWVGTFHAVAYRILKREADALGLPPDFTVADERQARQLFKLATGREELFEAVLRAKESLSEAPEELKPYLKAYDERLRKEGLLDFADLMRELYRLLTEHERGSYWRNYFTYVLVDEYQDTNEIQYEILKLLGANRVCAIGDPNQCIYEWRDARPDNVLKFLRDFKPKVVKLELNYRSREPILRLANAFLEKSAGAFGHLVPRLRGVRGEGPKPYVRRFKDEEEEALWIGSKIRELSAEYPFEEFAVLLRVSKLTQVFERTFFKLGIPYTVVGTQRFYEKPEVRAVVALLRLVHKPSDELAFRQVAESFLEGFGPKSFELVKAHFTDNWLRASVRVLKKLPVRAASSLYAFLKAVKPLYDEKERYDELLPELLEKLGYESLILRKYKKDGKERLENVEEFLESLREFKKKGYRLEEVLAEVALSSEEEGGGGVRIMTVHASKGLEFSTVFIPRLEEGLFPHASALEDPSEMQEERRLFYVAVTRAKDRLFLTYTRKDRRRPSRFLSDLPKRLLDLSAYRGTTKYRTELVPNRSLKEGDEVLHKVFGRGRILSLDGERAVVLFGSERKTIHTAFLERVRKG
ncbi:MAG: ATP-dependent helicase [Aquificae bacterium]|nr:ATP-dependent helicase [Aquificota bacterium]